MSDRARAAAEEQISAVKVALKILSWMDNHRDIEEFPAGIARIVADAVKERDERIAFLKSRVEEKSERLKQQAEEIARLRAEAELVPAVLAEKYQEGREDGITWAQQANDGATQAAVAAERQRAIDLVELFEPSDAGEEGLLHDILAAQRAAGEGVARLTDQSSTAPPTA